MAHARCHPQPGDLIEIRRMIYQHWALYVGDGYVIHVTGVDSRDVSLSVSSVSNLTGRAMVKKELLEEVAGNDTWCVNNKYDRYYTPFPVEEILQRAEQWIGKEVPYGLLFNNCEHFVTMLRYGQTESQQVANVFPGYTVSFVPSSFGKDLVEWFRGDTTQE